MGQARRKIQRALLASASALLYVGCATVVEDIKREGRQGMLVDGLQSGPWSYSYPNGVMSAQGEYRKDRQFGPWAYWYPNGKKEWDVVFGEEAIEGPSTFYFESGNRRAQGEFRQGYEDGFWQFWTETGVLEREGQYAEGIPGGRWVFFHPDGSRKAEGFYFEGEPVGTWSFWDESGQAYSQSFPTSSDVRVVIEEFGGGPARREGLGSISRREGRWVSYHGSGERRAEGSFRKGKHNGAWAFFAPDGSLIAKGQMEAGRFQGRWQIRDGDRFKSVSSSRLGTPDSSNASDRNWSVDNLAEVSSPEEAIVTWTEEIDMPFSGGGSQMRAAGSSRPPATLGSVALADFVLPIRPQPWTESELEAQDFLISLYTEGAGAVEPPPGSKYVGGTKPKDNSYLRSYGDTELADTIRLKQLPHKTFRTLEAERYDLARHEGKSVVVAVVLRGVAREYCVYCWAQTNAILSEIESFKAAGAEVVIIYPGPQGRLGEFIGLVEEEMDEGRSFDDVAILYDPGMELAREMGIIDAQAIPSTFILDKAGVVQYAYVGVSDDDRPSTKDLLGAIARLTNP